ncbi:CBS domain-containing protein [Sulfurimonas sp.]|uniref:GHMP family kinase ATP-binding protein n=1 Tax=Sulfurimonas sp. TaxID=2022749 RepID=UPI0025CEFC52|nr:CBS domain-containing protein [Sulfurimonas sp.]
MEKDKYLININDTIECALIKIDNNHLGVIFIEDKNKVVGCATDGDIRRFLLENKNFELPIVKCINRNFVFLFQDNGTKENILKLLDTRIKAIPILDNNHKFISVTSQKNINWNEKEKIISKAKSPVRISFAGGGTDLTTYFTEEDGVVLNTTINKFAHAVLEKRDDNIIKIFSNDLNIKVECTDITEVNFNGKLDLIKSVIKLLNPDFGFELYTYSDVPPGSGLGGSAVLLSAIIGTFNNFRENKFNDYEIAELAFHAERVELGLSGGWQDQYATVFGGFSFMEFKNHENIVNPLRISDDILNELEDSLVLCYTGLNHNSGDIHDNQKDNMKKSEQKEFAQISKNIAYEMKSKLLKGQLDNFGELLHKAWETKKHFSDKITTPFLDDIYEFALENGALGGKLLGAGGGGYFLFYVPTFYKIKLMNAIRERGLSIESFTFDNIGLRSWITKEKI